MLLLLLPLHFFLFVAMCRWGAMLVAFKREQLQRHNRTPIRCWTDLLLLPLLLFT
jgi:uncharacterized membrane protein